MKMPKTKGYIDRNETLLFYRAAFPLIPKLNVKSKIETNIKVDEKTRETKTKAVTKPKPKVITKTKALTKLEKSKRKLRSSQIHPSNRLHKEVLNSYNRHRHARI